MALGLLAALPSGRLVAGLLFGVEPTDPLTIVAVTAVMLTAATLACWIPAQRVVQASLLNVLRTLVLRYEQERPSTSFTLARSTGIFSSIAARRSPMTRAESSEIYNAVALERDAFERAIVSALVARLERRIAL